MSYAPTIEHDFDPEEAAYDLRILADETRTARKTHGCDVCHLGWIAPGEKYRAVVMVDDGRFRVERMCTHDEFDPPQAAGAAPVVKQGCCKRGAQGAANEAQAWAEYADRCAAEGG